MPRFYEFFAGGGMARAGLGPGWSCTFANDIDPKKAACYVRNWGGEDLNVADVSTVRSDELPDTADLARASFPCQDLSLAGSGRGLRGQRSGTFWPFWKLMTELVDGGRAPKMIVLENVCGALNSHQGRDFATIGTAIAHAGYRFGALVVDAIDFVPQSRPRLFIIAVHGDQEVPAHVIQSTTDDMLTSPEPGDKWRTKALRHAYGRLPEAARMQWIWWRLPVPPVRNTVFADLVEDEPTGVRWHTAAETRKLLKMMSRVNASKVADAKSIGRRMVGTIYKRTRADSRGVKRQRAEIRFDNVSGCLRTPSGGSSRQTIMMVEGEQVRSRLLSPREAARLMGLPDSFELPENYNEAYHVAGDGVVVPVVRHIAANILEPVLAGLSLQREAA